MSFVDLRSVVLYALSKASELLPDGSPFAENIRAARRQIDKIVDYQGISFSTEQARDGVLTILDQAFGQFDDSGLVFLISELHDIRDRIANTPVTTL